MKSNKKQIISILAVLTMAILLSCAFVACDKVDTDKTGTDIVADYKVTIHPNNGQGDIVWDITKEIPTITKDGFHIAGYFLDAQLTISTTLESLKATGITKNIDVYVKWEEDVCEHVAVTDAAVAPTCTEKGRTEGKHCSRCGKILQAQNEIPALGHDIEHHAGQSATCTEKGWKEYDTCKREGCDYSTYEEIPALGHTGGTATCTEQATCERCNEKYGSALGHKYGDLISKIEPTCSATGTEAHYKCSVCNKVFKDDEHKTETTHDELTIAINPNAHNFGNWIKNEGADTHTRVCSYNNEHTETENCQGGTATCIEQATCEKCNVKYGELAKHNYKDGVCIVCGSRRPSEGLTYSLNSDGNGYTVTGMGTCTDKELIIPSEYDAKPVTSIGNEAFSGCTGLTSVTIPDSMTSIGEGAFDCCTGLTSITVAKGNTKYHSAGNCLIETESKTLIAGCKNSIIPTDGSVTSIGYVAFSYCTGLTSVTIPGSVTSIGYAAFSGCTGLTSVTIPNSVTSIGYGAFSGCTGLTSITVAKENTKYHSAQNCLIETESKTLIAGCKNSIIPTDCSVTSIGYAAFEGCIGLTSVTIPDSVTSIGGWAFNGCTRLKSVTIPDSVTSIGNKAFCYCTGLTTVNWNSTACTSAGSSDNPIFQGCSNLATVNIGDNVKIIPSYAFSGCRGLTSITIPDSVTSIGGFAFDRCTGLTSITIPDSVTSIGEHAFVGCTRLTSITIPDSVTIIGDNAFEGCTGLTSITIPDSVTSIGSWAFRGCTRLTSVTIGNGVKSIGSDAFYNCTWLTSIKFNGTKEQWNAISKGDGWKDGVPATEVVCTDGTISISEA